MFVNAAVNNQKQKMAICRILRLHEVFHTQKKTIYNVKKAYTLLGYGPRKRSYPDESLQ